MEDEYFCVKSLLHSRFFVATLLIFLQLLYFVIFTFLALFYTSLSLRLIIVVDVLSLET